VENQGGRGARQRILQAASKLFYEEGINTTGMERLTEVAHVSKRTFYQHFPSKTALVGEYLHLFEGEESGERALYREDLTPRERLLGIFDAPPAGDPLRGCAFHNAAVEFSDPASDVRSKVSRHKREFTDRLIETAREAGAADPEALGRQLAVLFEGVKALTTSLDDSCPADDARAAAEVLIAAATA
jgi:AcrR family transcriptional regulator